MTTEAPQDNALETTTQPQPQQITRDQLIGSMVQNGLAVTIHGLLATIPGVSPQELLFAVAKQTGSLLGRMTEMGDFVAILNLRKKMKDDFREALEMFAPKAPPAPPPGPPKMNGAS